MTTTLTRHPWTIALRFTADVIEPEPPCVMADVPNDCQCTNVYGEPTEHGYGQTLESGWYVPGWHGIVQDEPTEPESFDYTDPDEWGDHVEAIADRILSVVGAPDHVDASASGVTVYGADPDRDFRTGTEVMVAAHVNGLGPAEADRLTDLLKG